MRGRNSSYVYRETNSIVLRMRHWNFYLLAHCLDSAECILICNDSHLRTGGQLAMVSMDMLQWQYLGWTSLRDPRRRFMGAKMKIVGHRKMSTLFMHK